MVRRENPKWPTAAASTTLSVYQKNIVEQSHLVIVRKAETHFWPPTLSDSSVSLFQKRNNFNSALVNLFPEKSTFSARKIIFYMQKIFSLNKYLLCVKLRSV